MLILKIKNVDSEDHVWAGTTISSGQYYNVPSYDFSMWQNSSDIFTAIGSGQAIVNDGENDITDISLAINYLKGIQNFPKDSDGSPLYRAKITTSGWSYQMHNVEFKTAQLDSIYSKKQDGTDFGFTTIKCYDANDNQLSSQDDCDSLATKTVIDWEPTHDYEVIGGNFKQSVVPTSNVRIWVIGVPDIPANYGGSKLFVTGVNLKYLGLEEGVKVDGRAPKYLTYNATYHTSKLRFILKHDTGYKHDVQVMLEIFKA